ncbi:hypothetical protein B0A48_11612 [Cryoendolithus antarcticus]|uniref:Protein EFR3 n=1 Tax=Cryoendolithus antarcticus TaxID=1507870 RepID=A0A1V8SWC3_9PEZI|nr:hypothetical protein B0A48_11612 [Cryoendolithus antarcticus]
MVKSHLPGHMDTARQLMRPKWTSIACYPRLPKNSSADVKPNGSELSYLVYYASTRRSKLQKVGSFLEKKAASDVGKLQSTRVLVTLQIFTALLENKVVGSGNGFNMIAPYVLRTIHNIVQVTNDISLIEASVATWEVFCHDQDQATLAADGDYRELYEQVVRDWVSCARNSAVKKLGRSTTAVSVPDAVRLWESGLDAIKAMLKSDTLGSEIGRQLNITLPAILTNLRGENALYLTHLQSLSTRKDTEEKEKSALRRPSMSNARTATARTGSMDSGIRAAEGTVQDADALAEEGVATQALDCLRAVFETENRAQVRSATSEVLRYLARYQAEDRPKTALSQESPAVSDWVSWAVKLFEMITGWTAVQDRFTLLVTASETLAHLPLRDADLAHHLLLTHLIDDILRSDLNLIGLSVMDILLGLIQQILRVLQLGRPPTAADGSFSGHSSADDLKADDKQSPNSVPSDGRLQLLARLRSCVADLATHVYYTDQIGDMVSAILLRLKPNTSLTAEQNPLATANAIEEPLSAVTQAASNVSQPARERSHSQSGGFFTFDTARQIALESVRDVLIVANSSRSRAAGGVAGSRSPVSISTWEGTQWLLRDPSPAVRRAYVDALCTWLALETRKGDARIREPKETRKPKQEDTNGTLARRALSNASNRERQSKRARNTFLQLLHLAIYETAVQHASIASPSSEADLQMLHLLSVSLVQKLGINALQTSLPMLFALQEAIVTMDSPFAKIRLGSLFHGYLWHLSGQFQFDTEATGREVELEISRRQQHKLWMNGIAIPPVPLERIPQTGPAMLEPISTIPALPRDTIAGEQLKPFDHRQALIDRISEAYATLVVSPLPSPPTSPNRTFSIPALDRSTSGYLSARPVTNTTLPDKVKEAMMSVWTRESCLAAIAAAAPKSASLSGSRSSPNGNNGTAANHRSLLGAANNGPPPVRSSSGTQLSSIPGNSASPTNGANFNATQGNYRQQAFGLLGTSRVHSQSPNRRVSGHTSGSQSADPYSGSDTGANRTLRVDELKRVLAGGTVARPYTVTDAADDTGSESMVEVGEADRHLGSESEYGGEVRAKTVSPARAGKPDLEALLEGIGIGGGEEEKGGLGRPPY